MFTQPINTPDDVRAFFRYLVEELKLNFHPDTDFKDYVSIQTENAVFFKKEVRELNEQMEKCFEVCNAKSEDIYEIGMEVLAEAISN